MLILYFTGCGNLVDCGITKEQSKTRSVSGSAFAVEHVRYDGADLRNSNGSNCMDYAHFMAFSLLGAGPALAIFFLLGAKRRAWIPPLAWWLSLALGVVACFYGMSHSTVPSFSRRITALGRAYDHFDREIHNGYHHDSVYGFRFVPNEGNPINLETQIILPDWNSPAIFDGQSFRVVYLDDAQRAFKNEAIDIEILSGKNAGFHDSYDARPLGKWLAIPFGAALGVFGFAGLRYMKDDAESAASSEDDEVSSS